MRFKKAAAAILSISLLLGATGCDKLGSKKDTEKIKTLIEDYGDALKSEDADAVVELTDWKKTNEQRGLVQLYLDNEYYTNGYGETGAKIFKYIISTIDIKYKEDDIEIEKDKASVKIKYELVDWEQVLGGTYSDYGYLLSKIKACDDTMTVKAKISFERVDGEWKITKLSNFEELFSFILALPFGEIGPVDPTPTPTVAPTEPDPTETDPTGITPTGTNFPDEYSYAIEACLWELDYYDEAIKYVEKTFDTPAVGIYDIDGDGIPELYYLTEDKAGFSAKLCICYYNEYAGEMIEAITVPGIIYQAASGGLYIIYVTDKELIVCCSGGEDVDWHITSDIYDFNWNLKAHYERRVIYDYDPNTDYESYTYEYYKDNKPVSASEYSLFFDDVIRRTTYVIAENYSPTVGDNEYQLNFKPEINMMYYKDAVSYLNTLSH